MEGGTVGRVRGRWVGEGEVDEGGVLASVSALYEVPDTFVEAARAGALRTGACAAPRR